LGEFKKYSCVSIDKQIPLLKVKAIHGSASKNDPNDSDEDVSEAQQE
jgi:hypothetical protein